MTPRVGQASRPPAPWTFFGWQDVPPRPRASSKPATRWNAFQPGSAGQSVKSFGGFSPQSKHLQFTLYRWTEFVT